ncbi:hypothetical protein FQA39_LY08862 [Lamprigera yunnana]|nr:hypothetical protein FQA39_LY08862 [Lamprigera yunnana]
MAGSSHLKHYSRSYNYKLIKKDISETLALSKIDSVVSKKRCLDRETSSRANEVEKMGNYSYYVVEFLDEAVDGNIPMSVISHSWLSKNEKGDLTCLWPKRAIDSKIPIDLESRISFIFYKWKQFTYEKALSKMNALENMQSVDQSEVSEVEIRKRGTHKSKHFEDFISSSGSEEDLPCVNLKTKRMKRATTDVDIFEQGVLEQPTTSQHSQENNDFELIPHQYNNNNYLDSTPISWRSFHNSCGCKNNELLLKNLLTTIKSMCSEIKIIKQCLSFNEDGREDSELTKLFPFTTQEQLELEKLLSWFPSFNSLEGKMCVILQGEF